MFTGKPDGIVIHMRDNRRHVTNILDANALARRLIYRRAVCIGLAEDVICHCGNLLVVARVFVFGENITLAVFKAVYRLPTVPLCIQGHISRKREIAVSCLVPGAIDILRHHVAVSIEDPLCCFLIGTVIPTVKSPVGNCCLVLDVAVIGNLRNTGSRNAGSHRVICIACGHKRKRMLPNRFEGDICSRLIAGVSVICGRTICRLPIIKALIDSLCADAACKLKDLRGLLQGEVGISHNPLCHLFSCSVHKTAAIRIKGDSNELSSRYVLCGDRSGKHMAVAKGELDGNVLVGLIGLIAVKAQEA